MCVLAVVQGQRSIFFTAMSRRNIKRFLKGSSLTVLLLLSTLIVIFFHHNGKNTVIVPSMQPDDIRNKVVSIGSSLNVHSTCSTGE